jgi:hypothetical protein
MPPAPLSRSIRSCRLRCTDGSAAAQQRACPTSAQPTNSRKADPAMQGSAKMHADSGRRGRRPREKMEPARRRWAIARGRCDRGLGIGDGAHGHIASRARLHIGDPTRELAFRNCTRRRRSGGDNRRGDRQQRRRI